jgi:hypothetical protein
MEDFIDIMVKYGPYIGLAVVVAGITQALKLSFSKFFSSNTAGMRIIPFIPIVLGMLGGFMLPVTGIANSILIGGTMGTLSASIYNIVTRSLASKAKLDAKIE